MPINTTAGGQIGFCIRLANGSAWPWAQVDSLPAEGVVLESSTNGGWNWTAIGNYDDADLYNWTGAALAIPEVAQGPAVLFRWRQLANDGTNYDHWALDNVVIGTGTRAPQILMDPQSQSMAAGDPGALSVTAVGTPPLSYQWLMNGTNITGATASSLSWAIVHTTDAGTYSVLVSNNVSVVVSSNAVVTVYTPVCVSPPAGLVGWWAAEGDATDSYGTNNGTLEDGVTFGPGRVGQAFNLNGSGAYVQVPDNDLWAFGTSNFTIELWANFNAVPTGVYSEPQGGAMIANDEGPYNVNKWLFALGGGLLTFHVNSPSLGPIFLLNAPFTPVTNHWYHLAVVRSGNVFTLYRNGVAVAWDTNSVAVPNADAPLTIGKAEALYFNGRLDEVSIYRRDLSATEIAAIYNAGNAGKCQSASPPNIQTQPQSQAIALGGTALMSVIAAGPPPLSYQWRFNGAGIAGATNPTLTLANVQVTNAGSYSVAVTNPYGTAVSSNAILTVLQGDPCVSPPAGLVSWWAAENNANDPVGGNNGSLQGGATYAAGEVGLAFSLNGSGAYVQVPDSDLGAFGTNNFTIELWAKFNAVPGGNPGNPTGGLIIANDEGPGNQNKWMFATGGGQISFHVNSPTIGPIFLINAPFTPVVNQWYHLAVVRNGTTFTVYRNGVAIGSQSSGVNIPNPNAPLTIGMAEGYYFNGLLDEVSIYRRNLSASEIAAIYDAGSAGKCGLAPYIQSPPQSQVVECSSNATFSVTASGLPPLSYCWYFGANPIPGATNGVLTLTNVGFAAAGSYSVTVSNVYGNATGGPAMLTVVDTTPPTIFSCASNRTYAVGANCTVSLPDLTGEIVAGDASGPVTVSQSPSPGTLLSLGPTNVIFRVRDSSGNIAVCTSTVTAADTTPPFVQACVVEVTLSFDANCRALLPNLTTTNYIVASDNCSAVSITQVPLAGTAMPVGTNTVVLTVSDASSNQTTRAVSIIVPDAVQILSQPTNVSAIVTSNATFS